MSRLMRDLAIARCILLRDEEEAFEMSEMREEIGFRWYLEHRDERLASEDFGFRIDDCLVEYIGCQLSRLKQGGISKEEFELAMRVAEAGIREDPDLNAYEATLLGDGQPKLAGEIYLDLARRLVPHGKKQPRLPKEDARFARVVLAPFMKETRWVIDWDIKSFSRSWADNWWRDPNHDELHNLIQDSPRSLSEKQCSKRYASLVECKDANYSTAKSRLL